MVVGIQMITNQKYEAAIAALDLASQNGARSKMGNRTMFHLDGVNGNLLRSIKAKYPRFAGLWWLAGRRGGLEIYADTYKAD